MMTKLRFMLTNPDVWGDPDVFRPERFLEAGAEDLPNPMAIIFGYGIRYVHRLLVLILNSRLFV
jgi:cytochrome P450